MKNVLWIVGIALVVVSASLFSYYQKVDNALAGGNFNNVKQYLTVNANPTYNNATSTNLVFIGNATTSYAFSSDNAESVDFNLFASVASSTAEVSTTATILDLHWYYEFSDDQVVWSREDVATVSGQTVTHSTEPAIHTWTPRALASTTRNVLVSPVASKYMRINFSSWTATSTRVGLWAQAILKKSF